MEEDEVLDPWLVPPLELEDEVDTELELELEPNVLVPLELLGPETLDEDWLDRSELLDEAATEL